MAKKVYSVSEIIEKHKEKEKVPVEYDYSKTEPGTISDKITVVCPKHGVFEQSLLGHINGKGCIKCAREHVITNRGGKYDKTVTDFIERAKRLYGERFSYDDVDKNFQYMKYPAVKIHCNEHNTDFYVTPTAHLRNRVTGGCQKCMERSRHHRLLKDNDAFITQSIQKYGDKFTYDKVKYAGKEVPVTVTCKTHGDFDITPHSFLSSRNRFGCPLCTKESISGERRKTTEIFVSESVEKHGQKYDYSETEYRTAYSPVKIICHERYKNGVEHGEFWQTPHNHLHGQGCPKCKNSNLETDIIIALKENNIRFTHQKTFEWLGRQTIDVFVEDKRIAIECQGVQHFDSVDFGGNGVDYANKQLNYVQELDSKKRTLCKEHDVILIYYVDKKYVDKTKETGVPTFSTIKELLDFIDLK